MVDSTDKKVLNRSPRRSISRASRVSIPRSSDNQAIAPKELPSRRNRPVRAQRSNNLAVESTEEPSTLHRSRVRPSRATERLPQEDNTLSRPTNRESRVRERRISPRLSNEGMQNTIPEREVERPRVARPSISRRDAQSRHRDNIPTDNVTRPTRAPHISRSQLYINKEDSNNSTSPLPRSGISPLHSSKALPLSRLQGSQRQDINQGFSAARRPSVPLSPYGAQGNMTGSNFSSNFAAPRPSSNFTPGPVNPSIGEQSHSSNQIMSPSAQPASIPTHTPDASDSSNANNSPTQNDNINTQSQQNVGPYSPLQNAKLHDSNTSKQSETDTSDDYINDINITEQSQSSLKDEFSIKSILYYIYKPAIFAVFLGLLFVLYSNYVSIDESETSQFVATDAAEKDLFYKSNVNTNPMIAAYNIYANDFDKRFNEKNPIKVASKPKKSKNKAILNAPELTKESIQVRKRAKSIAKHIKSSQSTHKLVATKPKVKAKTPAKVKKPTPTAPKPQAPVKPIAASTKANNEESSKFQSYALQNNGSGESQYEEDRNLIYDETIQDVKPLDLDLVDHEDDNRKNDSKLGATMKENEGGSNIYNPYSQYNGSSSSYDSLYQDTKDTLGSDNNLISEDSAVNRKLKPSEIISNLNLTTPVKVFFPFSEGIKFQPDLLYTVRSLKDHNSTKELNLSYKKPEEIDILATSDGEVNSIFFNKGDSVKEGSVLLSVKNNSIKVTKESLTKAKEELNQRKDDYSKAEEMHNNNIIGDVEFNKVKSEYTKAKKKFDNMTSSINDLQIASKFDGEISDIKVKIEDSIKEGDPILSMIKSSDAGISSSVSKDVMADLYVDYDWYNIDLYDISKNNAIAELKISDNLKNLDSIETDGDKFILHMKLTINNPKLIDEISKDKSNNLVVRISLKEDSSVNKNLQSMEEMDKAKSIEKLNSYTDPRSNSNSLYIPKESVMEDSLLGKKYVYVFRNSLIYKQYISTGRYYRNMIEVKEGLNEADKVVLYGIHFKG